MRSLYRKVTRSSPTGRIRRLWRRGGLVLYFHFGAFRLRFLRGGGFLSPYRFKAHIGWFTIMWER
jgi:hypothetical protein